MSAADISAIPTANTITENSYRRSYKQIILTLPKIVKVLNNTNPDVTQQDKIRKLERIRDYINNNLQVLIVAIGSVTETNDALVDLPEVPPP